MLYKRDKTHFVLFHFANELLARLKGEIGKEKDWEGIKGTSSVFAVECSS